MSHYFTVVLVDKNTPRDKISDVVDGLLAPYDENIETDPYDRECHCVGEITRKLVNELISAKYKSRFAEAHKIKDEKEYTKQFKLINKEYLDEMTVGMKNHPLYNKPDPSCTHCKGTGITSTTYNEESKWDWYRIGGRFNGVVKNQEDNSEDGFNFSDIYSDLKNNLIDTKDYLELIKKDNNLMPFALVTPDGEWYERGNMGWFGVSSDNKDDDEFFEEIIDLIQNNINTYAIGCDLHI